jgi:hypothetical protein
MGGVHLLQMGREEVSDKMELKQTWMKVRRKEEGLARQIFGYRLFQANT